MLHKTPITEPYPGPRPFNREEREIFFGRDEETADLRDLCMSYQVAVLYSQSGAGKSSLIRAGLRPALLRQRVKILPVARVSGSADAQNAGKNGNVYLSNVLRTAFGEKADMSKTLAEHLHQGSVRHPRAIVFDQFEELFTAYLDLWRDREAFFLQLKEALKQEPELRMIFVIREEKLAELDTYGDLLPTSFRIRYRLERLKEDAALLAIQQPPVRFGWSVDDVEAKRVIANLRQIKVRSAGTLKEAEGEYIEPVHLQVVCQAAWSKRPWSSVSKTLQMPDQVQGIDEALSSFYDTALSRASQESRVREARIRDWFDHELITPRLTRGIVFKGEKTTEGLPNATLDILEREHIVRSEPRGADSWYELTHDRFVAPVRHSNSEWRKKRRRIMWPLYGVVLAAAIVGMRYLVQDILRPYYYERAGDSLLRETDESLGADRKEAKKEIDAYLRNALRGYGQARQYFDRAGKKTIAADVKISQTCGELGRRYLTIHEYAKAVDSLQQAVIYQRDDREKAADQIDLARALFADGRTEEAVDYYRQAAAFFQEQNDNDQSAKVLRLLGDAYLRLGKFNDAEQSFHQALGHLGGNLDQAGEELLNTFDLGLTKSQRGDYPGGKDVYYEILIPIIWKDLKEDQLNKKILVPYARVLREMAFDDLHLKNYSDASGFLEEARKYTAQTDKEQLAYNASAYAEFYLECAETVMPDAKRNRSLPINGTCRLHEGPRAAVMAPKALLQKSRSEAEEAKNDFTEIKDQVMADGMGIYIGRADTALGRLELAEGHGPQAQMLFEAAKRELYEAYKQQARAQRKITEAYALQGMGKLEEAQALAKAAIEDYKKSYSVYCEIQVAKDHLHFNEVRGALEILLKKKPHSITCEKLGALANN